MGQPNWFNFFFLFFIGFFLPISSLNIVINYNKKASTFFLPISWHESQVWRVNMVWRAKPVNSKKFSFSLVFFFEFHLLISIWLRIKLYELFCLLFIRLLWSQEGILLNPSLQSTIYRNNALLYCFFSFQLIFFFISFCNINFFSFLIITLL